MTTTIDVEHLLSPDQLAVEVGNQWVEWRMLRQNWTDQTKEIRNYVYATDTTSTANAILPWSNTTTTPKLTQIADNLHANYTATLFPQANWVRWTASSMEDAKEFKAKRIKGYMGTKIKQSKFVQTHHELLRDYILYGNAFSMIKWVDDYSVMENGEVHQRYKGPMLCRISPYDIMFNPAATSFIDSPKIIRSLKTLGELKREADHNGNLVFKEAFEKTMSARAHVRSTDAHYEKGEGFTADGFSNIQQYYNSDYVEVLTFYGDMYNKENGEFLTDRKITIIDRAYVVGNEENPSWHGRAPIHHVGWRERPDNLIAMGPLDNLIGLQYRIDHLENLKADVFDQIAYPVLKIKGDIEDFDFEPGARIYLGEEGDVAYLQPDATALQADMQINQIQQLMEELAGAPKQAMGIRTPGEKTAFEVQSLQNSASRIFEHKTAHYERVFIEVQLNDMLAMAARLLDTEDMIEVVDEDSGAQVFQRITKEDIIGKGSIDPMGARHFAERARRVQQLQQLWQIKANDPTVAVHLSGKEFARLMAHELGEEDLFQENVAISEQAAAQKFGQELALVHEEQGQMAMEEGI